MPGPSPLTAAVVKPVLPRTPRGIRSFAAAVAIVGQAACSSMVYPVNSQTFSAPPSHPRDPANVEVLTEVPERPFIQVARLSTESINYDTPGHAVDRLRRAAAEHGADAIIVEARGTTPKGISQGFDTTDADFGFGPAVQGPPNLYDYSPSQFARVLAIRWVEPVTPASGPASRPLSSAPVK